MNATDSAKGATGKPNVRTSCATSGIMTSTAASFVKKTVTIPATHSTAKYKRRPDPSATRAATCASHAKSCDSSAAATITASPAKKRSTSHSASRVAHALGTVSIPPSSIKQAPISAAFHSEIRSARKTIAPIVSAKIAPARKPCVTAWAFFNESRATFRR